jgi:hypothetical protein
VSDVCPTCDGFGETYHYTGGGPYATEKSQPCRTCGGAGAIEPPQLKNDVFYMLKYERFLPDSGEGLIMGTSCMRFQIRRDREGVITWGSHLHPLGQIVCESVSQAMAECQEHSNKYSIKPAEKDCNNQ